MRSIAALIRVSWLTHTSYRLNVLFSLASMVALFIPVYLVANALQPVVARSIANEGEVYFGFLITGMAVMQLIMAGINGLPNAVSGGIRSGTLEALFATPTPLPYLLLGMMGYGFLWAVVRSILLIAGYAVVGGQIAFGSIPLAALILALTILAHVPVGLVAASMILVFRTSGPLIPAFLSATSLLGGVYYSTTVIPEIVRRLADFVPLTYGLRAFRRTLLSGEPLAAVIGDVSALAAIALVFLTLGSLLFAWSLRYARRAGSLAQY